MPEPSTRIAELVLDTDSLKAVWTSKKAIIIEVMKPDEEEKDRFFVIARPNLVFNKKGKYMA